MTLEAAYSEAGPKIVGYLVATGTDEAAALDLLHDAVLRVARRLEDRGARQGDEVDDNLPALLFATARNLRANRVRDDARLDFKGEVADGPDGRPGGGQGTLPSDAAYMRGRIEAALGELPAALRETYVLYQVGAMSVREVAEATGASENLVKVRLHRAKMSLRKSLAGLKEE